ncbi:hypothetical protein PGTUg99_033986 [Puccinia graminis f. sp. tritici]|uniref:Uncharacterized protein n=1 Tax=Puccinia graminis f. sp. tritici TaxID=56615 RepID=A0A5B0SFB6_PUCGR|nr:hypothetical protein PGTUg99_007868 [Puccinia graminis f. sp. tritici]KAA1136500.1 hypothetical protein PGTUg99_033986 [Puccinia graminis f. sp. tritici]
MSSETLLSEVKAFSAVRLFLFSTILLKTIATNHHQTIATNHHQTIATNLTGARSRPFQHTSPELAQLTISDISCSSPDFVTMQWNSKLQL